MPEPVRPDARRLAAAAEPRSVPPDGVPMPQRHMGDPDHRPWPDPGGAGRRHRQCRAADHCAGGAYLAGEFDLGGERLPARGDDLPAAAVLAGRDLRLPPDLPGGAGAVHAGVAGLRAVVVAADADHRAHAAGLRRGGDHERQQRADPLHLSAPLAGPRGRAERDGGSIASALGPTVASAILAVAPWPWLFAVNVPLGMLAAFIALRTLPQTPRSGHPLRLSSARRCRRWRSAPCCSASRSSGTAIPGSMSGWNW